MNLKKILLITSMFFVPLIAGAKDTCRKSDKACMVSREDTFSREEGIFLDTSAVIQIVLPQRVVVSTDSVISDTGLSVSTAMSGTDIPETAHIKLEKSK
ncbi:MAG: hypothetical protein AB1633_09305, partial [Elusimicrobiota bacterium]